MCEKLYIYNISMYVTVIGKVKHLGKTEQNLNHLN